MSDWRQFELECVDYLKKQYGNFFEHLGFSDSTTSDIKYNRGDKSFFIEAKMPQAQSGQFVLLPDLKNRKFIFSPRNKSEMDKVKFSVIDSDYMIRLVSDDIYRIRKLSNTYNANVIFSIKLKREQEPSDLLEFESHL